MGLVVQNGPWLDKHESFQKNKIFKNNNHSIDNNFSIVTNPSNLRQVVNDEPGISTLDVADWIEPIHREPFILQASLYDTSPKETLNEWTIISKFTTPRAAVWRKSIRGTKLSPYATTTYCVGLKGTSIPIDYLDDVQTVISLWQNFLLEEGDVIFQNLFPNYNPQKESIDPDVLMFAGHSLGGFGAIHLASKYRVRGCSFNGAGTVLKTTDTGLHSLITHYHIVGDFISSHVSIQSCKVLRVLKPTYQGYTVQDTLYNHTLKRFQPEPVTGFITADHEDSLYLIFSHTFFGLGLLPLIIINPIPGANRSSNQPPQPQVPVNPNRQPTITPDETVNKQIKDVSPDLWTVFLWGAIAVVATAIILVAAPEALAVATIEEGAVIDVLFDAEADEFLAEQEAEYAQELVLQNEGADIQMEEVDYLPETDELIADTLKKFPELLKDYEANLNLTVEELDKFLLG